MPLKVLSVLCCLLALCLSSVGVIFVMQPSGLLGPAGNLRVGGIPRLFSVPIWKKHAI